VATQIREDPTEEQVAEGVEMLKLLADNTRLRILWTLLHSEHSVNELAAHLAAPSPGVSQHLAKLRLGRLVRVRREGNRSFYAVDDDHVRRLVEEALFHADHVGATRSGSTSTGGSGPAATRGGRPRARAR
jgi:ArsR family transcriptional regulator, zinc-responsive transcriptional repressor